MRYKVIIAILAAMVMVGCFKEVTKDTNLIIKTLVQSKSGTDNVATSNAYAYACYTGTDKWMVASYEDAVNRMVTDSLGIEKITVPDVEAVPFTREDDTAPYLSLPLNDSPALVVLVYPQARMYATLFKYLNVENLHQTYMTLLLHTWKDSPYTEGNANKGGVWNIIPSAPVEDNNTTE
jgi:hypothetical protein